MKTQFFKNLFIIFFIFFSIPTFGFSKKKPAEEPPVNYQGKHVIEFQPLKEISIELPDQKIYSFGKDYRARIVTKLTQSNRFIISDSVSIPQIPEIPQALTVTNPSDYEWPGSWIPAANIRIEVESISFWTGNKGTRTYYGFDEKSPQWEGANEFPLKENGSTFASWFDYYFEKKGEPPLDSRAGLDLGEGFEIDFIFAYLKVKHAKYESRIQLKLILESPYARRQEIYHVDVSGQGYYYDIVAQYNQYSGGIQIARKDAMLQALRKAIDDSYRVVDKALQNLPLTARVDGILKKDETHNEDWILLGTGPSAEISTGALYHLNDDPETILEVIKSTKSGSITRLKQGSLNSVKIGQVMIQHNFEIPTQQNLTQSGYKEFSENITTTDKNIAQSDFNGQAPEDNITQAKLQSIIDAIYLPSRIVRYKQYDQDYNSNLDFKDAPYKNSQEWHRFLKNSAVGKKIGLDQVSSKTSQSSQAVRVAVIDTGVDYNHPILHQSIFQNSIGERGWDFYSNDSRAYDDAYQGTQVSSTILGVAPSTQIIPVKIFNPWGITSSQALYNSFQYAIEQGAQIIVCAWSTRRFSQAIQKAIELADDYGVLVVTTSGERGHDLDVINYYPAGFKYQFDNLIVVAATDLSNQLLEGSIHSSNYSASWVDIVAPGKSIPVAEPRNQISNDTTNRLAAGFVAGALARIISHHPQDTSSSWKASLFKQSQVIPSLEPFISDGKSLFIEN